MRIAVATASEHLTEKPAGENSQTAEDGDHGAIDQTGMASAPAVSAHEKTGNPGGRPVIAERQHRRSEVVVSKSRAVLLDVSYNFADGHRGRGPRFLACRLADGAEQGRHQQTRQS